MDTADFTTITVKKICLFSVYDHKNYHNIMPFEEAGMFIPLI
jgi:hypothetical protein